MKRRTYVGRETGFMMRVRVYEAADCFEIDESDGFRVARKRVYFDDVELVTLHRERSPLDWLSGLAGACVGGGAMLLPLGGLASGWSVEEAVAYGIAAAIGFAIFVPCAILLARGREVVTIFGRRTKARFAFVWRHEAAHGAFNRVAERVRAVQARLRTAQEAAMPQAPAAETSGDEAGAPLDA